MAIVNIDQEPTNPEVVLRIKTADFGSFLHDILSQKKNIKRKYRGRFVVDKAFALDLVELVSHRVKLQNTIVTQTFSVITYYNDGYQHSLESIDAYETFRDVRQSNICALQLNIAYLLLFPGRDSPEKQTVNIFFKTDAYRESKFNTSEREFVLRLLNDEDRSSIELSIDYTDISWGNDIEVLISKHLEGRIRSISSTLEAVKGILTVVSVAGILVGLPILYTFLYKKYQSDNIRALNAEISKSDMDFFDKINKQLELLIDLNVIPVTFTQILLIIFQLFAAFVSFLIIIYVCFDHYRSFIICNDFAKLNYERYEEEKNTVRYAIIISFIVSTMSSLFASFAFEKLKLIFSL